MGPHIESMTKGNINKKNKQNTVMYSKLLNGAVETNSAENATDAITFGKPNSNEKEACWNPKAKENYLTNKG